MTEAVSQKYEAKRNPDFEKEVHGILTKLFKDIEELKERVEILESSGGK